MSLAAPTHCSCSGPEIELILSPQKLICKARAHSQQPACMTLFIAGVKWDFCARAKMEAGV